MVVGACIRPGPTPVPQPDQLAIDRAKARDRLTLCAAGSSVVLGASAEIDLVNVLRGDGEVTADLRKGILGAVFDGADISNPNVKQAYDQYLECVEKLEL